MSAATVVLLAPLLLTRQPPLPPLLSLVPLTLPPLLPLLTSPPMPVLCAPLQPLVLVTLLLLTRLPSLRCGGGPTDL